MPFPVLAVFQRCVKKSHYLNYLSLDEICLDYIVSLGFEKKSKFFHSDGFPQDNAGFEGRKWCTGSDVAACIYSNMKRGLSWGYEHQTWSSSLLILLK